MGAGLAAASAGRAVARALTDPGLQHLLSTPVHLIAAGKAAGSMIAAAAPRLVLRTAFAVGTHSPPDKPPHIEWCEAGHPLPDERSVAAGTRALEIAAQVRPGEWLLILLSGGASALLSAPAPGVTLADKRRTIDLMMRAGADIHALNTVRKHLSSIKGGRLAAGCRGATLTLAVSDVIGDDVSVIGSGPGVADATTWDDAAALLDRWGGAQHPPAVRDRLVAGRSGSIPDTPTHDAPELVHASGRVIANRQNALDGARAAAEALGYRVVIVPDAVTGEARDAAAQWFATVRAVAAAWTGRLCLISAGETTVRVTGTGKGGRNQEFALALAAAFNDPPLAGIAVSVGTDGIDGPTDAAGALVDATTLQRGADLGLGDPRTYLERNDSYAFFDLLGDLVHTGRTDTNVGDLQIYLRE